MRKLFLIAIKDLTLVFRDPAALVFMLLAPFVLTIGLGLATGSFSSNSDSGVGDIPVVIVNADGDSLGNALVEVFQSDDLADLLEPQVLSDYANARQLVDDNKVAAVVYVPAGFTNSIVPVNSQSISEEVIQIELYGNPTSPTSVGIVKSVLEQFLSQVEIRRIGGVVSVTQMLESGIIQPSEASSVGFSIGQTQATEAQTTTSSITLKNISASGSEVHFNTLALLAPGMALMFLMYTVSYGASSLIVEKNIGTLPRLLISPTSSVQVLGGKIFGIFLTGVTQVLILIIATGLLFRLEWGNPLAVLVLVLATALAATGWGILLAAAFKTIGQISAIGSAMMLTFGILSGSFTNISAMPEWVQWVSRISPNRWGLDGFTTLAMGGTLSNILTPILALVIMAFTLFLVAVILFQRRGIGRN